jgi:hypothetical protein
MKAVVCSLVLSLLCVGVIVAQQAPEPKQTQSKDANNQNSESSPAATNKKNEPPILIYLTSGGRLEVEEARETNDGVWYKSSGVTALLDRKRVVRIERPSAEETKTIVASEKTAELTEWTIADAAKVERFFFNKFGRHLPTTAVGQSDLHTRWGLDHRQGIDVGVHPDSPEGLALAAFLRSEKIPFMAFRTAIPGVATGPHIHVGYASHRIPPR